MAEEVQVAHRAQRGKGPEHGQHEAPVAHPVGDERLLARGGVGLLGEPERDEQVGADAHPLPAQEGEGQVVAQHQDQHGEGEEVEVDEELREVAVAVHVADGVEVDERPHAGDEQSHGHRQRIDEKAGVHREVSGGHPLEERDHEAALRGVAAHQAGEHRYRGRERADHGRGGQPAGPRLAQATPRDHQHRKSGQRECTDEPGGVQHLSPSAGTRRRRACQPLSRDTSSARMSAPQQGHVVGAHVSPSAT